MKDKIQYLLTESPNFILMVDSLCCKIKVKVQVTQPLYDVLKQERCACVYSRYFLDPEFMFEHMHQKDKDSTVDHYFLIKSNRLEFLLQIVLMVLLQQGMLNQPFKLTPIIFFGSQFLIRMLASNHVNLLWPQIVGIKFNILQSIQYPFDCCFYYIQFNPTMEKQVPLHPQQGNQQDSESEWSLESLEELKGLTLSDLKEDIGDNIQPQRQKTNKQREYQVNYPPKQVISASTNLLHVGKIIQKVGELYIVEAGSHDVIVDLNNCVFNQNRKCLGFIIDVLGRVDQPFYAIKLFIQEQQVHNQQYLGASIYYAQGCKTLTEEDIKSIQGKRNVEFDEDISSSDEDRPEISEQIFRKDFMGNKNRRKSFDERPSFRERTREKNNRNYRPFHEDKMKQPKQNQMPPQFPNNQEYLQNMYAMYYQQMMQMQGINPQHQGMTPYQIPQQQGMMSQQQKMMPQQIPQQIPQHVPPQQGIMPQQGINSQQQKMIPPPFFPQMPPQ